MSLAGEELRAAVQTLLDKQELYELLIRFCRACNRADAELFLSCYLEDAIDEHGPFVGQPLEFLAMLQRQGSMDPAQKPEPLQYALTNALFDVDGDVAYGESYVEVRIPGEAVGERTFARYVDRFERRDGTWRIARRRVVMEQAPAGMDITAWTAGSRDRNDPSYERGELT